MNKGTVFALGAQKSLTIKTSASSYFVLLLLASTVALQVLGSPVFQSCFMASSHSDRTTKPEVWIQTGVMIGVCLKCSDPS